MSIEQRGIIASLHEKDWNGTMLYSFKIEGVERYWRLGQKQPEFEVGDAVQFTERNSNVDWDSIKKIDSKSIPEVVPTVDVGTRIQYQAARADATRLVVAALHTEALPWTETQRKAKSKRLDLLLGYVAQVTEHFLEEENKL